VLNRKDLTMKPETKLASDLGIESIDLLDISCELEKSIGRELDFRELAKHVATKGTNAKDIAVRDVVEYIQATQ
jgi:acyl carrier protein